MNSFRSRGLHHGGFCHIKTKRGGRKMAKTAAQRQIEKATGISRRTSGAATKNKNRSRSAFRNKSNGGQGG